jgi:hypothetical protein
MINKISHWKKFESANFAFVCLSCLKRLKIYLRNSMGEERLSGIALLNIERNFEINLDQIVTDFIVKKDIKKTKFFFN